MHRSYIISIGKEHPIESLQITDKKLQNINLICFDNEEYFTMCFKWGPHKFFVQILSIENVGFQNKV